MCRLSIIAIFLLKFFIGEVAFASTVNTCPRILGNIESSVVWVGVERGSYAHATGVVLSPTLLLVNHHFLKMVELNEVGESRDIPILTFDNILRLVRMSRSYIRLPSAENLNEYERTITLRVRHSVYDLGVVEVATPLTSVVPATFSEREPREGESGFVVGNPSRWPFMVSPITFLGRDRAFESYIAQLPSRPIRPGSSGSAVLNCRGEVVAVHLRSYAKSSKTRISLGRNLPAIRVTLGLLGSENPLK